MQSLIYPSPAKINLFLHILGRDPCGYHRIQTVFQLIDYHDTLQFYRRADKKITCVFSPEQPIEPHNNLIIRAAELLQTFTQTQLGADIIVDKRIPLGSGLGGGSSNAATTLIALNHLWKSYLPTSTLMQLAKRLGSDIPVFVYGRCAWAQGYGEKLQMIQLPQRWFIVLIPNITIHTQEIFSHPQLTRNTPMIKIDEFLDGTQTRNDCESLVRYLYPEIDKTLVWLNQFTPTRLTGTGSCLFASTDTQQQAVQLLEKIRTHGYRGFLAKGLDYSPIASKKFGV
jgi:4-diphosphocytidyl-2-C-methyl-D-erythritol kinase